MPIKFRESGKRWIKNPETGRSTSRWEPEHHYIKGISQKELIEYINNDNGKPKIKEKARKELNRRGIKLVLKTPETG
jgi:hypothetical protein